MAERTAAVWKALADPIRRRLLDALREGPKTTGALCRPIRLSRFAVMKHLAILVKAGLVIVRPRGRERWHYLNAVPIREIYERWVRSYEAHWTGNLLQLRDHVETPKRGESMVPETQPEKFGIAQVELAIPIKAPPARVWQALVGETTRWWSKDFYTSPAAKGFIIEPQLGGRAFEDWGDGAGQVWYTVTGIEAPRMLSLLGYLSPAFGGPATTLLELRLQPSGKGTSLQLSDTIWGNVGDDKLSQTRDGWKLLFEQGLKSHVEAG